MFGADHIVMGTDYLYEHGRYRIRSARIASVEAFDQTAVAALTGGNAHRLLGVLARAAEVPLNSSQATIDNEVLASH